MRGIEGASAIAHMPPSRGEGIGLRVKATRARGQVVDDLVCVWRGGCCREHVGWAGRAAGTRPKVLPCRRGVSWRVVLWTGQREAARVRRRKESFGSGRLATKGEGSGVARGHCTVRKGAAGGGVMCVWAGRAAVVLSWNRRIREMTLQAAAERRWEGWRVDGSEDERCVFPLQATHLMLASCWLLALPHARVDVCGRACVSVG